jgi:hypothetical protein
MMLGMMLARLKQTDPLSHRYQTAVLSLAVPPSMNLVGLGQEQKRKPRVLRRIEA